MTCSDTRFPRNRNTAASDWNTAKSGSYESFTHLLLATPPGYFWFSSSHPWYSLVQTSLFHPYRIHCITHSQSSWLGDPAGYLVFNMDLWQFIQTFNEDIPEVLDTLADEMTIFYILLPFIPALYFLWGNNELVGSGHNLDPHNLHASSHKQSYALPKNRI